MKPLRSSRLIPAFLQSPIHPPPKPGGLLSPSKLSLDCLAIHCLCRRLSWLTKWSLTVRQSLSCFPSPCPVPSGGALSDESDNSDVEYGEHQLFTTCGAQWSNFTYIDPLTPHYHPPYSRKYHSHFADEETEALRRTTKGKNQAWNAILLTPHGGSRCPFAHRRGITLAQSQLSICSEGSLTVFLISPSRCKTVEVMLDKSKP